MKTIIMTATLILGSAVAQATPDPDTMLQMHMERARAAQERFRAAQRAASPAPTPAVVSRAPYGAGELVVFSDGSCSIADADGIRFGTIQNDRCVLERQFGRNVP